MPTIQKWWNDIINDEKFFIILDHLKRQKRFVGEIQPTAHGQHYADGHKEGFDHALDVLQNQIAFQQQSDEQFSQTQHPDLE